MLPPSSLKDEQMLLRVNGIFALTNGERQANVREAEADSRSAGAHQMLTGLYSVPVSGKKTHRSFYAAG